MMKARVRQSGALDDVVRWGDITNFASNEGWWCEEFGRMWFPGAVKTCYSPGPPFDFVSVGPNDYVTRDSEGRLYAWSPKAFNEVFELVDDAQTQDTVA